MKKSKPTESPTLRCAIYTRKSTEDGLEQEYNSLDAQRDSGEAYVTSQKTYRANQPERFDAPLVVFIAAILRF